MIFAPLAARLVPYRLIIELAAMAACLVAGLYFGYTYADNAATAGHDAELARAFNEYKKDELQNRSLVTGVIAKNEQIQTNSRARIANDSDGLRDLIKSSAAASVKSCASAGADSGSSRSGLAGNQSQTRDSAIAEAIAELSGLAQSCADQTRNVAKTLAEIEAK